MMKMTRGHSSSTTMRNWIKVKQKIIREVFRSKQSIDFYNFMVNEIHEQEEWEGLVIPLKDLKHEFPNLYGDNINGIILENIKKDE